MQTSIQFRADNRSKVGTGSARAARRAEKIPAVIYGFGQKYVIEISYKEFIKQYLKGSISSKIIEIDLNGQIIYVITREVQVHPVTDRPIHVDFQQISADQPVKVSIRLKVANDQKCIGVKQGGVLNIALRQTKFYCLPQYIKSFIEIDVTNLKIGQSIHIKDVNLPEGITPVDKSNFVILSISGRTDDSNTESSTS